MCIEEGRHDIKMTDNARRNLNDLANYGKKEKEFKQALADKDKEIKYLKEEYWFKEDAISDLIVIRDKDRKEITNLKKEIKRVEKLRIEQVWQKHDKRIMHVRDIIINLKEEIKQLKRIK